MVILTKLHLVKLLLDKQEGKGKGLSFAPCRPRQQFIDWCNGSDKRQHYLPHGILWEHMSSTWHIEDKYVLPSSLNNFIKLNYMGKY